MTSEVFGRAHVDGHLRPPCFQWGFDAGARVTMQPEVQLFGFDLFDQTFDLVNQEWPNLLSGGIGCKAAPVVALTTSVESTGTGALIHLDASGSYDPDGGPLRFRWDFDDDGLCYRKTGSDPRTTFAFNPAVGSPCLSNRCTHVIRLRVTDDENTYTERTTSFITNGEAGQIFRTPPRQP